MIDINLKVVPTTHPDIIKLEATKALVKGSYEYKNIDEAKGSPLAQELFYLPFVKTVYISSNFIALKRFPIVEWKDVQEEVAAQVLQYLRNERPIVNTDEGAKLQPVTVYTESTPNPAVMKYVASRVLVPCLIEYKNAEEADESPMATALFTKFPYIKELFFDDNYLSITKDDIADWLEVAMELREFIRTYLAEGHIIIPKTALQRHRDQVVKPALKARTNDATSQQIIAIIERDVKPAVASDGGNIQFIAYTPETHQVEVALQGACSGCPSSMKTLKNGIEVILRDKLQKPYIDVVALDN